MYKSIAFLLLALTAVIHLIFGLVYITADTFMSYHAQALSTSWADLGASYQILLLALIKLAGAGGIIAGSVCLTVLAYFRKRSYSYLVWLAPFSAFMFQSFTNYVVYQVSANTPGNPPLLLVSFGSCTLVVAIVLFIKWLLDERIAGKGNG